MVSRINKNEIVAQELAKKIRLERQLAVEVRKLFRDMSNEFENIYKASGVIMPTNRYLNKWQNLLLDHYKRVSKAFLFHSRSNLKHMGLLKETKQLDQEIEQRVQAYINQHSLVQANIINNTNSEEILSIINKIRSEAALNGIILSNEEIAKQVSIEFKRRGIGRSETIAMTETQNVAEQSKVIEANTLLVGAAVINNITSDNLKKEWVTILDERTRLTHALADSQVVDVNQPFIVGGYSLMSPGDSSLGAPLEEIINCRCSTVYFSQ